MDFLPIPMAIGHAMARFNRGELMVVAMLLRHNRLTQSQ
jgi:hypothetical protein